MKAKVFTLRFDTTSRTIDDTAFQGFIEDRELLSLSDHIVEFDREPMMVLCVTYRDVMEPVNRTPPFVSRKSNPRDRLDDTEKALFDVLRLWRNKRAEAAGGPAYIVFTNEQLAEVARRRPQGLVDLSKIPGIGEARLGQFGAEVLELVRDFSQKDDSLTGTDRDGMGPADE